MSCGRGYVYEHLSNTETTPLTRHVCRFFDPLAKAPVYYRTLTEGVNSMVPNPPCSCQIEDLAKYHLQLTIRCLITFRRRLRLLVKQAKHPPRVERLALPRRVGRLNQRVLVDRTPRTEKEREERKMRSREMGRSRRVSTRRIELQSAWVWASASQPWRLVS